MNHPNLIFVFADQLRCTSCGFAGDRRACTPNIDRLASEGISFRNAVSGHPVCAPYRASLFTGKYTTSTGMVTNDLRMNPNHVCFGHALHGGGYDTAYIGKWHLWGNALYGASAEYQETAQQFTPPGHYRLGFDGYWASCNFNHDYYHSFYYEDTPERIWIDGYEPDAQTDLAIRWLGKQGDRARPFALFLSYGTPHDPWTWANVPEESARLFRDVVFDLPPNYEDGSGENWSAQHDRAWWLKNVRPNLPLRQQVYYAMVSNLDRNLGRLLIALEDAGLKDDTVVIFTSDHGEMFGAHGRAGKLIFYDESCRVPFLVRWPKRVAQGAVSDACLNTPDIMPTLLSLLGLPTPQGVEGMDLSHCALGKPGAEPDAAFLLGMGNNFLRPDGYEWRALRSKRHTYALWRADQREELYDNLADPYQMHNLAKDPAYERIRRELREMLAIRMAQLNDEFRGLSWYREHWTQNRIITHTGAATQ